MAAGRAAGGGPAPAAPPRAAAALALLAAAAAAGCARSEAAAAARNVILITIDTLRADRLSCYGSRRVYTPAIDRLAAEGVLFERAFTTTPLTAPAHASMLTGRYPSTHGLRLNGASVLDARETTLAEAAQARGMRTAAVVSCLVLESRFGLNQGFDLYYEEGISAAGDEHGLWYDERKAAKSVARALRWLQAESDRPFFLWLHLFDPHHPYEPPPPFKESYEERPYDGEIVYTDRALGKLLDAVERLGLHENTLIILAGDHGESLGEHQENFHGTFVYDATVRVPMIIRAPGGRRGARVADIASTLDVMPTALDALGIPVPEGVEGFSLMPAVTGSGRVPARTLYLESVYPSATYGWAEVRAVRTPSLKYVDLPGAEVYDLDDDPRELNNLHGKDPRLAQAGRAEFRELTARLAETARRDAETADLDEEFRNRLLSLGYIAGTESKVKREGARDPKEVALLMEPLGYARSILREKKHEEAIHLLEIAVKADPENKIGLVLLGRAYAESGRRAEGKATLRRAIDVYPDAEEIYRILGWMHIKDGEHDEAAALFGRLVHHQPRSGMAHYLYGFAWFYAEKWERSLQALEEARALSPRFSKIPYLMAIGYERTGRREEALAALDGYLRLEPDVESLFRDPYFADLKSSPGFQALIRKYL
jgi:arylsulfatase A-like enzyme/Flp pilus assembly protein TadD